MSADQCCGFSPFFSDPARIRIRGSGFYNPDPDLGDPKKTGSDHLDMVLMFSKKYNFLRHFLNTKSKHLMTL